MTVTMPAWLFLVMLSGYLLIPAMAWAKNREFRMRLARQRRDEGTPVGGHGVPGSGLPQ